MDLPAAIEYILVFIGFLCSSLFINWIVLRVFGEKTIKKTITGDIRWDKVSKPFLGGVSFFLVFLIAIICFYFILKDDPVFTIQITGILIASGIGFCSGLSDDIYHSNPYSKIAFQFLSGSVLIITGTYIDIFPWEWLNYLFTILWVVGLMNSINMFDNMDAIASIVTLFAIIAILITIWNTGHYSEIHLFLLIALSAAIIGFLFFNRHPSKMYMGDNGSQFLGACMAAFSIIFLWNFKVSKEGSISIRILLPLLAFLPSICDTIIVSINRMARGQSPFVGGKDHTSHHLSYLGLSDRSIALVFASLSLLCMAGVYLCATIKVWTAVLSFSLFAFSIAVLLVLFLITKWNSRTILQE